MSVRYSIAELKRRLVGSGGPVQFVTKTDSQAALEVFQAAARAAEQPYVAGAMEGEDFIATSSYAPLPDGPIGYMHICDNADLLAHWLASVAAQLEEAGLAGRLAYLRGVDAPFVSAPQAVAGISLNVDYDRLAVEPYVNGNPPEGWWVDESTTKRAVSRLVKWCLEFPPGSGEPVEEVWVFAGTGFWMPPAGVADLLATAIHSTSQVRVARTGPDGQVRRYVALGGGGTAVCGTREEHTPWVEQISPLQDLLKDLAPEVTHGFIRLGPLTFTLDRLWMLWPAVPYAQERAVHARMVGLAHLQLDYVPDAYAYQVITSRQLAKITAAGGLPPARWTVEDLGSDRWLVAARDPEPWLDLDPTPYTKTDSWATRTLAPPPEILAQARHDFSPALLTHQMHQDHPRPTPQDA